MSVTVDHELFDAEVIGLRTVGQVLSHLQRDNRLVTNLLIDGEEPDLTLMGTLRRQPLGDHTLYIETTDPRDMAIEVLDEVGHQLKEADRLKSDAIDLLHHNAVERALQKLSGCFSHLAACPGIPVLKTAQLLRIDLELLRSDGSRKPSGDMVHEIHTGQCSDSIKSAPWKTATTSTSATSSPTKPPKPTTAGGWRWGRCAMRLGLRRGQDGGKRESTNLHKIRARNLREVQRMIA